MYKRQALDKQVIKEIQMIFQDPQSSLNERAKVGYIVGEGLMNVRPDLSAAERDEKVRQALLDVGLLPELDVYKRQASFSWEALAYLALNKKLVLDLTPCGECENDVCAAQLLSLIHI